MFILPTSMDMHTTHWWRKNRLAIADCLCVMRFKLGQCCCYIKLKRQEAAVKSSLLLQGHLSGG